jgi:hypothetical protein
MLSLALPVTLLLAATAPAEPNADGRINLSLTEYDRLRQAQERNSVTVVDTLRLSGSFKANDLRVAFVGRASGKLPAEDVLASASGAQLFGCEGDGLISRSDNGFNLTPLAARFNVSCRVAMRGSDRLEWTTTKAVLWVESAVTDGEFVLGKEGAGGARSFTVVRRTGGGAEGLPATATARYRLTLEPDASRFLYRIDVRNPNRSRQAFDITLAVGERVQQIDATVPYDVQGTRYRFDLPPGELTLTLSGSFSGASFVPPLKASLQYLMVESHPLLDVRVKGDAQRVSPNEVGVAASYRGAQAFLLTGTPTLTWEVRRLEALSTTGYAVNNLTHIFFTSADGWARGETHLAIDNQGASELALPMDAQPTFASLGSEPVLLTEDARADKQDAAHRLRLPIPLGPQDIEVQHQQRFRRRMGLGYAHLRLPRVPVAATRAAVEVRYPQEWYPIAWSFMGQPSVWAPESGQVIGWLILFVWSERVLAFLGWPMRRRVALAALLALAAVAWGEVALALVAADLAASILRAWSWMRRARPKLIVVVLGLGAVGLLAILLFIGVLTRNSSNAPFLYSILDAEGGQATRAMPSSWEVQQSAQRDVKQKAAAHAPQMQYQGLPAKFEMPYGERRTDFSREMLTTDPARSVRVLMVSQALLWWTQALVVIAGVVLIWRARRELKAGWRQRVDEWRAARQK